MFESIGLNKVIKENVRGKSTEIMGKRGRKTR